MSRRLTFEHQIKDPTTPLAVSDNPFIYSSFANKSNATPTNVPLVAKEISDFIATLANPLDFDLDIQNITLSVSGTEFECIPVSTIIPARSRAHHVKLSGFAKDTGILEIKGCKVVMFGGCVEEEITPLGGWDDIFLNENSGHGKGNDGLKKKDLVRKQTQRERFGKKSIVSQDPKQDIALVNSKKIKVIWEQPLLEVVESSLGPHGALTLFEGETYVISLTTIIVYFIFHSFI